jgi:hypothetical protein
MTTVCSDISTVHFVGRSWKFWMSNLVVREVTTGYYRNKNRVTNLLGCLGSAHRIVLSDSTAVTAKQHYCYCTLKQCRMWNWNNFHLPPHNFASYFAVQKNILISLNKTTRKYPHLTFLVVTINKLTHTPPCGCNFIILDTYHICCTGTFLWHPQNILLVL